MAQSPKNHRCKGNLDGNLREKGCEGQVFSEAVLVRMKTVLGKEKYSTVYKCKYKYKASTTNIRTYIDID